MNFYCKRVQTPSHLLSSSVTCDMITWYSYTVQYMPNSALQKTGYFCSLTLRDAPDYFVESCQCSNLADYLNNFKVVVELRPLFLSPWCFSCLCRLQYYDGYSPATLWAKSDLTVSKLKTCYFSSCCGLLFCSTISQWTGVTFDR